MTKHSVIEIDCPVCGEKVECDCWEAIDIAYSPELKEKVMSMEMFKRRCPSCGGKMELEYDFIYCQPGEGDKGLMVMYSGNYSKAKDAEKVLAAPLPDFKELGKYTKRIVTEKCDVAEKIEIFDAGLDDRVIELVKIVLTDRMPDGPYTITDIRFHVEDTGSWRMYYYEDDESFAFTPFSDELYKRLEEDYADKIEAASKNKAIIDCNWAEKVFGM